MRAILRKQFGGPDVLEIREIPEPEPRAGHAVIQVKAFGLNHAELHMRKGEWAEIADVSGIECVGIVKSCPGGEFAAGTKVAALMGGLGRTINGSYAEYTRAPVTNVAAIESGLSWAELAAIPETYATAWTCLFRNLEVVPGQTLVVRGATSSFGQAALNMAVNAGRRSSGPPAANQFRYRRGSGAVRAGGRGADLSKRIAEAGRSMPSTRSNSTILIPHDAAPGSRAWRVAGRLARSPTSTRSADGERRYLTFFGSFVFGAASSVGRAAGYRGRRGGRPLPGKPTGVPLRGHPERTG
jgi:hypothetical protein